MTTLNTIAKPRKSLADQIDRLDTILDGLSDELAQAVADSVKDAVRMAVVEALTSPEVFELLRNSAQNDSRPSRWKPPGQEGLVGRRGRVDSRCVARRLRLVRLGLARIAPEGQGLERPIGGHVGRLPQDVRRVVFGSRSVAAKWPGRSGCRCCWLCWSRSGSACSPSSAAPLWPPS